MSGKTRHDKNKIDTIRDRKRGWREREREREREKLVEKSLRWFGHVERRPVDVVVRRVDQMEESQSKEVEEDLGNFKISH